MSSPWEDVRRESMEIPIAARRASPLPWFLLALALALMVTVLVVGRSRLESEKLKSAATLKANDELHHRLSETTSALDASRASCLQADDKAAELRKQMLGLELTNRRLHDEVRALKAKRR